MWNRREVKKRGKKMFLRNWLAMVSICFLLAFTGAEFVSSASFIHDFDVGEMLGNDQVLTQETNVSNWDILMHWLNIDPDDDSHPVIQAAQQDIQPAFDNLTQPFSAFFNLLYRSDFKGWVGICLAAIGVTVSVWFTIAVIWVLVVGARRFFLECRVRDQIGLRALLFPFHRSIWRKLTLAMLLKHVYYFLWSLTIVGLPIKHYSYKMVSYLLAENPNLKPREAIMLSRQMMDGQKWRCFVMDVTIYLPWSLLPALVLGAAGFALTAVTGQEAFRFLYSGMVVSLLDMFFVNGYKSGVYTELYTILRQEKLDQDPAWNEVFVIPAFGDASAEGPKPKRKDYPPQVEKDPVFHYIHQHRLDYKRRYGVWHLVLLFFAFSFAGWLWEVSIHIVTQGIFVNRGTMYGPWLPIYGCGAVLVLLLLRKVFKNPPLTFVVSMVVCSIIEYFASWYLEKAHGIRWWDYSGYFMNLNGRICLEGAVVFGLACCLVVYFVGPLLGELIDKIPPQRRMALSLVLAALFLIDGAYSSKHPNAGKGITDYDNWKQEEMTALSPEQTEVLLPILKE